jgi:hypothetical protein
VVSGLPNITPTFSRIWLVKMTDVCVAHLALDLSTMHERGYRVDHNHIHGIGSNEYFRNL